MLDRTLFDAGNCSVARTLAVVGEKWTLLVLREAFYGVRRFEELRENLGIARNLLGDRLATLVENGILVKSAYQEPNERPRFEYRLTRKGIDLFPAILALMQWGDRYMADPEGPPVRVRHVGCEAELAVELRCAKGHRPLSAFDSEPVPGPGLRRKASGTKPRAAKRLETERSGTRPAAPKRAGTKRLET